MVTIRPSIEGLSQMRSALSAKSTELDKEIHDAVTAAGLWLHGDIIKRYHRGPTSGRTYRKHNPKRTHRASAPGEAPQTDTGRLAGGMTFRQLPDGVEVVNRVKYARALEYGSRNKAGGKGKIIARPAWRPASLQAEKVLNKLILAALAKFTR